MHGHAAVYKFISAPWIVTAILLVPHTKDRPIRSLCVCVFCVNPLFNTPCTPKAYVRPVSYSQYLFVIFWEGETLRFWHVYVLYICNLASSVGWLTSNELSHIAPSVWECRFTCLFRTKRKCWKKKKVCLYLKTGHVCCVAHYWMCTCTKKQERLSAFVYICLSICLGRLND